MTFQDAYKHALEKSGKSYLTVESVKYLSALTSLNIVDKTPSSQDDEIDKDIKQAMTWETRPVRGMQAEPMPDDLICYRNIYYTRGKCWLKVGTKLLRSFTYIETEKGYTTKDYSFVNPIFPIILVEGGYFEDLFTRLEKYTFDVIGFFYGEEFHETVQKPPMTFADLVVLSLGKDESPSIESTKRLIGYLVEFGDDIAFSASPGGAEAAYLGELEGYDIVDFLPSCKEVEKDFFYVTSGHCYVKCDGEVRDYINPYGALMDIWSCDFNSLELYLDKLGVDVIKEFYSEEEEERWLDMDDIGILGMLSRRAESLETIANAVSRIDKKLGRADEGKKKDIEVIHPFKEAYKPFEATGKQYDLLDKDWFDKVLYPVFEAGENILMTGCAGSGKGVLVMALLKRLVGSGAAVRTYYMSCHSRMSAADVGWGEDIWGKCRVGALLEGMHLAEEDSNTRYVLVLDEVLSAHVRSIFGPAMDLLSEKGNTQSYYDLTFTNVKNFQIIATGNLGAMYNGQDIIDDAVRSRFHWVKVRGMFQSKDALNTYCKAYLDADWFAVLSSIYDKCPEIDIDMRELVRYKNVLPTTIPAIKDFLTNHQYTVLVGDGMARKGLPRLIDSRKGVDDEGAE